MKFFGKNKQDAPDKLDETTEEKKPLSFYQKLSHSLAKTKNQLSESFDQLFKAFTSIDESLYENLEEILLLSDVGMETTKTIISTLKDRVKSYEINDMAALRTTLTTIIGELLYFEKKPLSYPSVILLIGVNGVGKTTTAAKLAHYYQSKKCTVLLAAADTFRAAAIEQLTSWAEKIHVPLIKQQESSDPSAVIFDSIQAAKSRKTDILICDTAGRLHNKKNLMEELRKMNRIIQQNYAEANKEIWLVLDGSTGQNAVVQAKQFKEIADISGIILTKLDGSAKGGAIISIKNELDLPVCFIGVGEKIDDLQDFDSKLFAAALLE